MRRRDFLGTAPLLLAMPARNAALKDNKAPEPVPEPHFPSRLHHFVWRNWELANAGRMAQVIRTTPDKVLDLGASMGLPEKRTLSPDQLRRIYVTVIRQNWHLLPESQIIELLGWTREKYDFTLKEDDFLDIKLGLRKPRCAQIVYSPPTAEERAKAARVREIVQETFGPSIHERGQDLFHFVKELSDSRHAPARDSSAWPGANEIDLTKGWSIVEPGHEGLASAARRFQSYLREAMRADVRLTPAGAAAGKLIRFEARGTGAGAEVFALSVTDREVLIASGGEAGVLQCLCWMQDVMEQREGPFVPKGVVNRKAVWNPRYLYSYVALYGDPLADTSTDPFPDAYLERLARCGINGVWLQAVLNTLAPSKHFAEFGAGWESRLRNLDALVRRAERFGVRIYLYLNEPRAMPDAFFRKHPEIRGSSHLGSYAMCTSVPVVREWLAGSLAHILRNVPDLGGFFSITMSENHTNCFSHGGAWGEKAPNAGNCPRCAKRKSWEAIGELLETFRDGVRRASSSAEIIAWDWGWGDELSAKLIPLLPRDVRFLSISEWDQPVRRGGISTKVEEYSISVVGPGPRAVRNWDLARRHRVATMAKVQFNNTWEISAVPYIPAPHLILRHCENLSKAGISGIMPSWTCGGYPSPNLMAAKGYYFEPQKSQAEILLEVAAQRYGKAAAPDMVEAWRRFSEAFQEFPYGVAIYSIPTQHGPANPLRLQPTGYSPGMILFPYDDYRAWSGSYPPEVVEQQFARMAALWKDGLAVFHQGQKRVSRAKRRNADMDLAIAETCYHHFQSVANQMEFYLLRERLAQAAGDERTKVLSRMRALAKQEIGLARRQFSAARRNSAIAYEGSNHYYYTPLDLAEKVLNCRNIIEQIERMQFVARDRPAGRRVQLPRF